MELRIEVAFKDVKEAVEKEDIARSYINMALGNVVHGKADSLRIGVWVEEEPYG